MADSTGPIEFLADLVEAAAAADIIDWDTSALADWPHIAPAPATGFAAEPQAGGREQAD